MKPNFANRTIFLGDNLKFLTAFNSECVDLICTDPPFNKQKEFTAPIGSAAEGASFLDLFAEEDIKDEWVDEIRQEHFELHSLLTGIKAMGNSYNYCYLVYMAMRIIECRRVLKNTGSFYLHCDHTMAHYLKLLLDCIFGENNFRSEVIWRMGSAVSGFKAQANNWIRNHDTLFYYVKDMRDNYAFNKMLQPHAQEWIDKHSHTDEDGKNYYVLAGRRRYLTPGKAVSNVWADINSIQNQPMAKERTGWPTQKPLALYERIIAASSNKGDLVLDPFCGCVTTCIAAERLERNWVGIDVAFESIHQIKTRLERDVPADLFRGKANISDQPPKRGKQDARAKKYVYVMSNRAFPGLYKVGIAANAETRLSQYQTSDPNRGYQLEFKYLTANYREIEKYIHTKFNGNYEWVSGSLSEIINAIKTYQPPQNKTRRT